MRRMSRLLPLVCLIVGVQAGATRAEPGQPEMRASKTVEHVRVTWQQRFAAANDTHDGQLTRKQANTGFPSVARWFDAIDLDGKGYVTEDDIAAFHKAQRQSRPPPQARKEKPERPGERHLPLAPTPPDTTGLAQSVKPQVLH
jgi:hypothetical protein